MSLLSLGELLRPDTFGVLEDDRKNPERVPGFNRIVQQVRFTQKFVLTYHAFVVTVILVIGISHWVGLLRRKFRRDANRRNQATPLAQSNERWDNKIVNGLNQSARDGSSSSGSSTIDGGQYDAAQRKGLDEQTPLLNRSSTTTAKSSMMYRLKAMLMFQPTPLPFVNKTLPSNGTSLFIISFAAVNVFYLLYDATDFSSPFAFSDRAGMLFVANLPLLYFLTAKNQPLKLLTGHSYESLNIFHRRLGEWLCLLALFHATGMIAVWWIALRPLGWTVAFYLSRKIILLGLFALLSFEVLYLTSLASFRRKCYELFLVLHVGLQIAALILLWFHHHRTRVYVGTALAIFLVDRILFRAIVRTSFENATLTVLDSGTVKLSAPIQFSTRRWFRRFINYQHGWRSTDHVFLTVPALSRKHWIQAHPFTIASAAPLPADKAANLDLIIRAQEGFSRDLLRHAMLHRSARVRLDGPYGSQHAVEMLRHSDTVLLVAGGSGIAVVNPLVHALAHELALTKDEEANSDRDAKRRVGLVWIVREESHKDWLDAKELEMISKRGIDVIVPRATAENGRPDMRSLVQGWLKANMISPQSKAGVVCCGPDEMSRTVRNACAAMVGEGSNVDVLIEKFGW